MTQQLWPKATTNAEIVRKPHLQTRNNLSYSVLVAVVLLTGALPETFAADVRAVGSELQLFLDDWLIQSLENVRPVLHSPDRREAAIRKDQPWENIHLYNPVVIKDGHRYRMWYRAKYVERPFYTAYAESLDGIHWVKPKLGLIEFEGSKDNNIVWPIPGADGRSFSVFRDENPSADPESRYKAITNLYEKTASGVRQGVIFGLASPDGLRWRYLQKEAMLRAVPEDPQYDSHNIALWDAARQHYTIYARGWFRRGIPPPGSTRVGRDADNVIMKLPSGKERKFTHIRDIRRYTSTDYLNWSAQKYIGLGSGPLEHLYKNSATPYFRDPSMIFMFPKRFLPTRKFDPDWKDLGLSDIVFLFSRDGLNFDRRFMEAFMRPGRHIEAWHERSIQVGSGLVPTGVKEMSLYFIEHAKTAKLVIRRGVLRLDGFVSLKAPYQGGSMVTRTLEFSGSNLVLNYATSAAGSIRVEIQEGSGKPLTGYGLEDCGAIYGDEVERVVTWKGGSDLKQLSGQRLRLKFELKDADLYSLRFR